MPGDVRIGISGWRYAGWRGVFYPADLVQRRELEYASRQFPTIELNGSFYSLQRPEHYAQWYADTPAGFVFSVKGGRYITHIRRLQDVRTALANFFASGLLVLREKLGPLLWQFPPSMRFDAARLADFLALLPRDTQAAADLAAGHSAWMDARSDFAIDRSRPLRHAVEVRHASFQDGAFVDLLRAHGVALVVADSPGKWPYLEDVTADFMYLRLHGEKELYASGYTEAALERWERRIRVWRSGSEPEDAARAGGSRAPAVAARDVFCYFDNDAKVRAPFDAKSLMARLGVGWAPDAAAPARRGPRARAPDTGAPDAGALDAGAPDAGAQDAGAQGAGAPEATAARAAAGSVARRAGSAAVAAPSGARRATGRRH